MSIYIDKRTNIIYINFVYKDIRCRESLKLKATKQNLSFAKRLDKEIQGLILADKFDYSKYFPNSPKLKLFNEIPIKETQIKFEEYAKQWIERKEKEAKAGVIQLTTFKNYKSGFNRILKRAKFLEKTIKSITVIDIKNFINELLSSGL